MELELMEQDENIRAKYGADWTVILQATTRKLLD